jgi:hypothetical protein
MYCCSVCTEVLDEFGISDSSRCIMLKSKLIASNNFSTFGVNLEIRMFVNVYAADNSGMP